MATNLQGSSHRPRAVGFRLRNRKDFIYEDYWDDVYYYENIERPYLKDENEDTFGIDDEIFYRSSLYCTSHQWSELKYD